MASTFVNDCVKAMNVYRDRHQVSPLAHNPQLTSIAQKWADHLAAGSRSLSHNPNASYRGEKLGENCAMRFDSSRQEYTGTIISLTTITVVVVNPFTADTVKALHFAILV